MSTMTINGRAASLPNDQDALLVDVIRDTLNLTGTKLVCGSGVCGACTVLLNGEPVVSCLLPASVAAGKMLTTIEGIGATTLLMTRSNAASAPRDLWSRRPPSTTAGVRRKARQRRRAKRSRPRCRDISAAAAPMKESIALSPRLVSGVMTTKIRLRRAWKRTAR